ncbi:BRCA1-associated protein [Rhizoctonia solani AG-1 IB]|uniref:BRCA1-associated protein n=1 Tax=Thanatephorus cucumeris (strain AG1-IB / isolate 7/3/14) TaxID=1108050 RepID=M5BUE0_THACB|nr:BRCA1-associated protein [Rhizoctonia solani AG-1 IB]
MVANLPQWSLRHAMLFEYCPFSDVRAPDVSSLLGKNGHDINWAYHCCLFTYFPLLVSEQMGRCAMPCLSLFADDVSHAFAFHDANLWICLICGNIGCGRYARAHAHSHHEFSAHLYALELATQRVWDYAGDGYIHRLIHDRTEGKLVEIPSSSNTLSNKAMTGGESSLGPGPDDMRAAEKVEAVGLEYANLLASQLDSQRSYFEEQAAELRSTLDNARKELARVKAVAEDRAKEDEISRAEAIERAAESETARANAQKRADRMQDLARKLEKDLKAERAEAETAGARERMELQTRLKDVEEQLRDVMFFLEAKTTIEQQGDQSELAGGSIVVPETPPTPVPQKGGPRKKKSGR